MRKILIAATAGLYALAPQGDGIIRLKPREFRQLPSVVRRDLEKRGCTVPQYPGKTAPHNVISGSFIANGSRDWAVLCSVRGASRILVYRNSVASKVDSLARQADSTFMQDSGNGVMQFSRKIDLAEAKTIVDHAKAYGGRKPPPIDHVGIDDGFMEKASIIRYYYRGKWLELQGAN